MYEINQQVIHLREGLSTIIDSTKLGEKEYFIVRSNRSENDTIYVPIESAGNIIRPIMCVDDATKILIYMKSLACEFNTNTKQRRDAYKRRLSSGDIKDIAYLSRQLLHFHELGPENNVIKLGPVDLDLLSYAHNMLLDELSITFNIPREQMFDFIVNKINSL